LLRLFLCGNRRRLVVALLLLLLNLGLIVVVATGGHIGRNMRIKLTTPMIAAHRNRQTAQCLFVPVCPWVSIERGRDDIK
jgi:hypothetical protein